MTWPVLRGLRRQYPQAEIHILTRPRFEAALEGLEAVDRQWSLPSQHVLEPLIQEEADVVAASTRMGEFVQALRSENFDWVINFSFSPFSSHLTHAIAEAQTRTTGYTRFVDGTFSAGDDLSHYFYAQVGLDKANRVHVTDLFAAMVDVQYAESDWRGPVYTEASDNELHLPESFIAVHVGASDAKKALPASTWARALKYYSKKNPQTHFVLIGSANESSIAEEICSQLPITQVRNLVGKTSLRDIFTIMNATDLFVGCDSGPLHMASLTDTPTLNVSVGDVNFWETGPKASLAFVYRVNRIDQIAADRLGEILSQLMAGQVPSELITRAPGVTSYQRKETAADRFQWDLIQAIYMGESYPMAERMETLQGAMKLQEINNFAQEQLLMIPEKGIERVAPFLNRAEEVIQSISRFVPELCPLVNWYHAEKVRIGPGSSEDVLAATLQVHERFAQHLRVYIPQEETIEEEVGDGTL
ncbi:glycosyltransferase family 9 protein [Bdellovibrio sp. HCB2-146]|uniref:glycosyltransferase family 9 protein n=1 Tax=Bdellovibrio sp. HCB2-146 TaxID=3394362 RepID=UPI0039BCA32A